MNSPASVATVCLLLALSRAAIAETPDSGGGLTIVSRPAGAAFRLDGDRDVVGRTPLTLGPELTGRYRVRCIEPGFEGWRRSVVLGSATADTLWAALRPKTFFRAGGRSALVPGWGQFYAGRSSFGWGWLVGGAASGGALVALALRYEDTVRDFDRAEARYRDAAPTERDEAFEALQKASRKAEDAYRARQVGLGIAGGVWALNLIDAMALFPKLKPGSLGVDFRSDRASASRRMAVALRARF